MTTKIEWTDETWNPVTGCTKISPGCANCYAERMCRRFWKEWDREPPPDHFKIKLHPDRLEQPLHWKKPRRVFVCSMSDLFHEDIPMNFIAQVFKVIASSPQHTFQILTKRPRRAEELCGFWWGWEFARGHLDNAWLGVTIERSDYSYRAEFLRRAPAAIRFVSFEPLLGPMHTHPGTLDDMDWAIIGCESGPNRRLMQLEWARDLVSQCQAAGVPVFIKQLSINGRVSRDPAEWPEDLQIREYPE